MTARNWRTQTRFRKTPQKPCPGEVERGCHKSDREWFREDTNLFDSVRAVYWGTMGIAIAPMTEIETNCRRDLNTKYCWVHTQMLSQRPAHAQLWKKRTWKNQEGVASAFLEGQDVTGKALKRDSQEETWKLWTIEQPLKKLRERKYGSIFQGIPQNNGEAMKWCFTRVQMTCVCSYH